MHNSTRQQSCPFLWYVVPLPPRFHEECVVRASESDKQDKALDLRTTVRAGPFIMDPRC